MSPTHGERLDILEQQMDALSTLPERVASLEVQFLQFRDETGGEFAAVRAEMRQGFGQLRAEMHERHADTLQRFDGLRAEMLAGDEETRRHARVLHEEVLARIALLDEHWNGKLSRPRSRTKPPSGGRR